MQNIPTPLVLLDRLGTAGVEAALRETRHGDDGGPYLCCRSCLQRITAEGARFSKAGSHRHRFTNPLGYRFEIGCFAHASGCRDHGSAIRDHTWFAGYAWRIALCGACTTHLGWRFESGVATFYGLILERLMECDVDRPH